MCVILPYLRHMCVFGPICVFVTSGWVLSIITTTQDGHNYKPHGADGAVGYKHLSQMCPGADWMHIPASPRESVICDLNKA